MPGDHNDSQGPLHFPSERRPHHSDDYNHDRTPATPEQIAEVLRGDVARVSQGDAVTAKDVAGWVHELQRAGKLDQVGTALSQDENCKVLKNADGKVTELIFNANPEHPVGIKIGDQGNITVNGKDAAQLDGADTDFVKRFKAEQVNTDASLSAAAKDQVIKMENALVDGDSNAFIAAVKGLQGKEELAEQVTKRLRSDLMPTDVTYTPDGKGGGTMKLQYYGDNQSIISITTDGTASAEALSSFGQAKNISTDPVAALADVGRSFHSSETIDVDNDHAVLNIKGLIPNNAYLTPEQLADREKSL